MPSKPTCGCEAHAPIKKQFLPGPAPALDGCAHNAECRPNNPIEPDDAGVQAMIWPVTSWWTQGQITACKFW